jgi:hypothetical protein
MLSVLVIIIITTITIKVGETFGGDGYVYGTDCSHGFMGAF